eukprot:scaffold19221_cov22-Prasinocladus_malaysianus.AAC.1
MMINGQPTTCLLAGKMGITQMIRMLYPRYEAIHNRCKMDNDNSPNVLSECLIPPHIHKLILD